MIQKAELLRQPKLAVEEFLRADAKVFYEYVFSTKHIGRTLDLLLFEAGKFIQGSNEPAIVEYKIRQFLQMGIFNAWTNYRKGEKIKGITVECGWDSERAAILVSSLVDADVENFMPDGSSPNNEASNRIASMVEKIRLVCDEVVVRHSKDTGTFQILAFVASKQSVEESTAEIQYIDLKKIAVSSGNKSIDESTSVVAVPLANANMADLEAAEKENHKRSLELRNRKEGREEDEKPEYRVSGATEVVDEGVLTLKRFSVEGAESTGTKDIEEILLVLLSAVRAELVGLLPNLSENEFQTMFLHFSGIIRENFIQAAHHLSRIHNIQMIAKIKQYKDQITQLQEKLSKFVKIDGDASGEVSAETILVRGARTSEGENNLENGSAQAVEARFNDLIGRFKQAIESGEVPAAAKSWAHGMMEEVLKDKASITQKVRDFDAFAKKREHEYRSKETGFKEQLRIKEEELKQRTFSLDKTKESLQSSLSNLERTKKIIASTESEAELKHKISVSEKLLALSKDNNDRFSKRIDDLQKKWQEEFNARSVLQQEVSSLKKTNEDLSRKLVDSSSGKVDAKEISLVSTQRDRAQRMTEELKKQIKELQDKMANQAAQRPTGGVAALAKKASTQADAEAKHKLDHSAKLVKAMKDELDRTKRRFEDLKLEETKLRVELAKTQAMLKVANKNTGKK